MFVFLFLITALAASTELPTTDPESKELQELIAIFTTDEIIVETVETEQSTSTEVIVAKAIEPITITNAIEPSMLEYKHWTGTYNPETFTITVNGTEVAQGTQHTLPADTKAVDVAFHYSFMNGMRKGTKTVSYELHENSTQANITFAWKNDWQVLVDNATATKKVSA